MMRERMTTSVGDRVGLDVCRLDRCVTLIAGGCKGLGQAMGAALVSAGADAPRVIRRHGDETGAAASTLATAAGRRGEGLAADVTDSVQGGQIVARTVDVFGRIDSVINNAGVNIRKPTLVMGEDEWDHILDVNLAAPSLCSKAVAPHMIERNWGRIINISSMRGAVGLAGRALHLQQGRRYATDQDAGPGGDVPRYSSQRRLPRPLLYPAQRVADHQLRGPRGVHLQHPAGRLGQASRNWRRCAPTRCGWRRVHHRQRGDHRRRLDGVVDMRLAELSALRRLSPHPGTDTRRLVATPVPRSCVLPDGSTGMYGATPS